MKGVLSFFCVELFFTHPPNFTNEIAMSLHRLILMGNYIHTLSFKYVAYFPLLVNIDLY